MEIETATTTSTEGGLSNCQQKYTLYCLQRHSKEMKLADITDQITVWETGSCREENPERRLSIYNSLYYDHVPALCDAKIVTYDQRADTVELTGSSQIRPSVQHRFRQEMADLLETECRALEQGEQA